MQEGRAQGPVDRRPEILYADGQYGSDANGTMIAPACSWRTDTSAFHSRSRNCPYDGWYLTGRATHTIVGGTVRYSLETAARGVKESSTVVEA